MRLRMGRCGELPSCWRCSRSVRRCGGCWRSRCGRRMPISKNKCGRTCSCGLTRASSWSPGPSGDDASVRGPGVSRLGWREVKLGIFSKRDRAEPATPDEGGDRKLPKPNTCVAFAAIEASDQFGTRWKAWAKRRQIREVSAVTVLADGAK